MKRQIQNPFAKMFGKNEYKCFGCSPYNELGLQLKFTEEGDSVTALWEPKKHFEGFFNILHGGIQSTLQDEVAGWLVFTKCKTSGVTKKMQVEFLNPVYVTDKEIKVKAQLREMSERIARIQTQLFNSGGEVCSSGEIEYYIFPEAVAKRKHSYPGIESFYKQ